MLAENKDEKKINEIYRKATHNLRRTYEDKGIADLSVAVAIKINTGSDYIEDLTGYFDECSGRAILPKPSYEVLNDVYEDAYSPVIEDQEVPEAVSADTCIIPDMQDNEEETTQPLGSRTSLDELSGETATEVVGAKADAAITIGESTVIRAYRIEVSAEDAKNFQAEWKRLKQKDKICYLELSRLPRNKFDAWVDTNRGRLLEEFHAQQAREKRDIIIGVIIALLLAFLVYIDSLNDKEATIPEDNTSQYDTYVGVPNN